MSAWYIWTSLGMYPLNPASGEYVFGVPLVHSAQLQLPNGKTLAIGVEKIKEPNKKGIASIQFNNKEVPVKTISHASLLEGGTLTYTVYE